MLKPLLQDDAFLADVAAAPADANIIHLWWLGQSGYLLKRDRLHLLIDPYLSDSLSLKYASTDKPHTRMTERVVAPERLDFIDIVTSSHNHTDHLDGDTLRPLLLVNPNLEMLVPEANRAFAADRIGVLESRIQVIDDGRIYESHGIEFTGIAAAHNELERDDVGHFKFLGLVIDIGGFRVYHSGDTLRYDGMVERLQSFNVDLALLPINGNLPERRVAGNLNGAEAAQLAHDIGACVVIPCHYDMFEFNTATPDEFMETAAALGQPTRVLRNGERATFTIQP